MALMDCQGHKTSTQTKKSRGSHTALVILETEHPGNANVTKVVITYLYFDYIAACQYLCLSSWMPFCI